MTDEGKSGCVASLLCLLFIGALCWVPGCNQARCQETVTATVKQKWPIPAGKGFRNGLTVTREDGRDEVLQVGDNWPAGVFNSSDTYAALEVGQRYRLRLAGWRNHFWSQYRNVLRAERAP